MPHLPRLRPCITQPDLDLRIGLLQVMAGALAAAGVTDASAGHVCQHV